MNEQQARTTANVLMAAAALGAAVFVLRNPKLRRLAWQMARDYSRGPLGAVLATTVRNAWDSSATATPPRNLGAGPDITTRPTIAG